MKRQKTKPAKKAKARGVKQPSLPGLEPSKVWLKMKATPKKSRVEKSPSQRVRVQEAGPGHPSWRQNVIPGKCTCEDRVLDNGVKLNPWYTGHAHWCSMYMTDCDECGQKHGTHMWSCSFWNKHNVHPL